jgi:hypothetical protein
MELVDGSDDTARTLGRLRAPVVSREATAHERAYVRNLVAAKRDAAVAKDLAQGCRSLVLACMQDCTELTVDGERIATATTTAAGHRVLRLHTREDSDVE